MNILFFLKQKQDVIYIYDDNTLQEALTKMEPYRYSAIPVISRNDEYIGTLTEGDILWYIKNNHSSFTELNNVYVKDIKRIRDNSPIHADEKMISLLNRSMDENFVPVLDSKERFIGIITRKEIIEYFLEHNFVVL